MSGGCVAGWDYRNLVCFKLFFHGWGLALGQFLLSATSVILCPLHFLYLCVLSLATLACSGLQLAGVL